MAFRHFTEIASVITAPSSGALLDWVTQNKSDLQEQLTDKGIVLLRGFEEASAGVCETVLELIGDEILEDAFWSTPRKRIAGKTFSATEMAPDRTIPLHSEMSYMTAWPRLLAFHALSVAAEGGTTTVCDLDAVSRDLSHILGTFSQNGVIYQRTHRPGLDIPWKVAYRTEDPAEVERIASNIGMDISWLPGGILQTRHKAQGTIETETGDLLWFNQSNLFHPASLPPTTREQLTKLLGADGLPRNAFYGDGSTIPDSVIYAVNEAFQRHTHGANWQVGDVLIIDNMRYAHGRAPFAGERSLHVAMANKYTLTHRSPLFAHEVG